MRKSLNIYSITIYNSYKYDHETTLFGYYNELDKTSISILNSFFKP